MCRVVNFKQYGSKEALGEAFGDRWTYIGRANSYVGLAGSPLANPFKVKENHFYRANRELGRIFKTEHVLRVLSDPLARRQIRRGLLKSEEMRGLARQVAYGKQGKISARDLHAQLNTSNCLTIIMACIIFWQAREISRVIQECEPQAANIDLGLLEHISPIGWENVILYGEYVLNRNLVRA